MLIWHLSCKTLPSIGFWLNVQFSYYANFHIVELSGWCGNLKFHMKISYVKRLQFHMWKCHMWKFHMWKGSNSICVSFICVNFICVNFLYKFHMWKGSNSICGNFICETFTGVPSNVPRLKPLDNCLIYTTNHCRLSIMIELIIEHLNCFWKRAGFVQSPFHFRFVLRWLLTILMVQSSRRRHTLFNIRARWLRKISVYGALILSWYWFKIDLSLILIPLVAR